MMGLFDWLFGRKNEPVPAAPQFGRGQVSLGPQYSQHGNPANSEELAMQRYRYMLQTAPPETIEQAHVEAFSKMTPAERVQIGTALAPQLPPAERVQIESRQDDPYTLARVATRAEVRQPGTLERTFAQMPAAQGGVGGMGMMAGSIFAGIAAGFVGSMIAQQFMAMAGDPFADAGMEDPGAMTEEPGLGEEPGFGEDMGFGDDTGFGEDIF
jgi:hypothetical protein